MTLSELSATLLDLVSTMQTKTRISKQTLGILGLEQTDTRVHGEHNV